MTLNNRKINQTELLNIVNNSNGVNERDLIKLTNCNSSRINALLTRLVAEKVIKKDKLKQNYYYKSKIDLDNLENVKNLISIMDIINKFKIKYSRVRLTKDSKTKEKVLFIDTIIDFKDVLRK